MPTGDGLIVRLRISSGIVDIALARQIAQWSDLWGNGQIDLSSRGNLQLRGLSAQHLPSLHGALAQWDLLDRSAATEAVRNIIASPLSGLDPTAVLDIRPIVRALERCLAGDALVHSLPAKFGFAIDDGGMIGLDDVPADIRFTAVETDDGPVFDVRLDGAPDDCLGYCQSHAVADVAAALSRRFLHLLTDHEPAIRRMRDLTRVVSVEAIARDVGLRQGHSPWVRRRVHPAAVLGAGSLGSAGYLGVGLPFGSITADRFSNLAEMTAAAGGSSLRLTPWRALLLPVGSLPAAHALAAELAMNEYIVDAADPRWRIAACPGAPACQSGSTPTRRDAADLAAELGNAAGWGTVLHVSGCAKGCAHPKRAPLTLIGRDGRYDLVHNGRASDTPTLRSLTPAQAAAQIRQVLTARALGGAA